MRPSFASAPAGPPSQAVGGAVTGHGSVRRSVSSQSHQGQQEGKGQGRNSARTHKIQEGESGELGPNEVGKTIAAQAGAAVAEGTWTNPSGKLS